MGENEDEIMYITWQGNFNKIHSLNFKLDIESIALVR